MATVQKIIIPPTPPKPTVEYHLALSEAEAKALRDVFGHIANLELHLELDNIYDALNKIGLEYESETTRFDTTSDLRIKAKE